MLVSDRRTMEAFPHSPDESESLELLGRIQAGDRSAWEELYRRYHDQLLLILEPTQQSPFLDEKRSSLCFVGAVADRNLDIQGKLIVDEVEAENLSPGIAEIAGKGAFRVGNPSQTGIGDTVPVGVNEHILKYSTGLSS